MVTRDLLWRTHDPVLDAEKGSLFKTSILNEIRLAIEVLGCGGEIGYYRTSEQSEVDFIWHRSSYAVGIKVKASTRWRSEYSRTMYRLINEGALTKGYVVYLGDAIETIGPITIYPVSEFVRALYAGEILLDG